MRTMRINRETNIIQEKHYKKINHAVLEENSIKGIITSFREETPQKKSSCGFRKETA